MAEKTDTRTEGIPSKSLGPIEEIWLLQAGRNPPARGEKASRSSGGSTRAEVDALRATRDKAPALSVGRVGRRVDQPVLGPRVLASAYSVNELWAHDVTLTPLQGKRP